MRNLICSFFYVSVKNNFIHGDFHHSNFLFKIEDNELKLIVLDFGIVCNIEDEDRDLILEVLDYEISDKERLDLIKKFLGNTPEIELADIVDIWADTITEVGGGECPPTEDGMLHLLPGRDGTDGFFIAVMQARLR